MDVAYVGKWLGRMGAEVRVFVPRVDTGGLARGLVSPGAPVPVEPVPVPLSRFGAWALPGILSRRVRAWGPDYAMITNTFAMAPWVFRSLRGVPTVVRIFGYEMLCPFYMSLWPVKVWAWARANPGAQVCTHDALRSPARCTWCALHGMGRELLPWYMNPFSHEYVASIAFTPLYHRLVRAMLREAHAVVVYNHLVARMLHPWTQRVHVVPGGVDLSRFTRAGPSRRVVLMPGRVDDPRKGYAVFREAIHLLVGKGLRFTALVTDPRYDGNSPHIESTGWVPYERMPQLMASARVVVVPTMWPEPFGLVVLEAMACGTPVVAHRIGGLASLVEDGVSGFLVDPGDVEALADRVARILEDDELHARLSDAAVVRAAQFSWERVVREHYAGIFGLGGREAS